ncbi:MAG: hypothetical protein IJS97_01295 [Prevotella sp.]|nr:hypothetical protein [Prevotella sp.]
MGLLLSCTSQEKQKYAALLAHADSLNKIGQELPSDTLMQEVADYYEHHGTTHERLLSQYLLGLTYHDMGEAPMALSCYQRAVEQVDINRNDYDLRTLCAVYGQMADLYDAQTLPNEEMNALQRCEQIAWKNRDTLWALKAYEFRIRPYDLRNDTDSILYQAKNAYQLYRKYGYNREAASVLYMNICICINRQQYQQATEYMKIYKRESGLYDPKGNIMPGMEIRYYDDGRYQLGIGNPDSALYYFRRLLDYGYDEAAYKGMLDVYTQKNIPDSIAKYARLFTRANDDSYLENSMELVQQQTSLYNYERNKRIAEQKEQELLQTQRYVELLLALILLATLLIYILLRRTLKRRKMVRMQQEELNDKESELDAAKGELDLLYRLKHQLEAYNTSLCSEVSHLSEMIDKKEVEKKKLLGRVSYLQARLDPGTLIAEKHDAPIVAKFRKYAMQIKERPSEEEWEELVGYVDHAIPDFHAVLSSNGELATYHYRLCCLLRLGFDNADIKILIPDHLSNITMTYKNLHKKILQTSGSALEFKDFIMHIGGKLS